MFKNISIIEVPNNKHNNIKVNCKKHGEFTSNIKNMTISLNPCPYCSRKRNFNPIEILKENNPEYDFSKFKYITSKEKSIVICSKHGEFKTSFFNSIERNYKVYCSSCYPVSRPECLIREYIRNKYALETKKDRSIIRSKVCQSRYLEIDIYIPELKIGFEFNGTYWHSDEMLTKLRKRFKEVYVNAEGYHNYKLEEAKRNNIDLYFITEEEFDKDINSVYKRIDEIINQKINSLSK